MMGGRDHSCPQGEEGRWENCFFCRFFGLRALKEKLRLDVVSPSLKEI